MRNREARRPPRWKRLDANLVPITTIVKGASLEARKVSDRIAAKSARLGIVTITRDRSSLEGFARPPVSAFRPPAVLDSSSLADLPFCSIIINNNDAGFANDED